jgi:DNA-binding NarL/FixJ family response regulator/signal transduction histidine kinase
MPSAQRYRRDVSRRNWAFDIALAAAVGVLGQLEVWWGIGSTHRQGPLWVQSLLYAVTALLLVGRRVRPLGCLTAMVVVSIVEFVAVGSPEGFGVSVALLIATYTVGNRLEWRRSWIALVLAVVAWVAWAAFDPMNTTFAEGLSSLVWLTPSIIAWLLGALVRVTRLNAEQRRVNREQRASQAVAEERNRIARELHDVIGHSVSVMTVQASAVRRRLTPEQEVERQALETVEAVGREALAEMRRMVGVLRQSGDGTQLDPKPGLEPTPGLDQVDQLAEKFRTAGVTGEARDLAPGLDLTAIPACAGGAHEHPAARTEPAGRRGGDRLRDGPDRAGCTRRRSISRGFGSDGRGGQRAPGNAGTGRGLRRFAGCSDEAGGWLRTRGYAAPGPDMSAVDARPAATIGVLIVDDQALVRAGFRMILEIEPDLYVVGEAADGDQAVAQVAALGPDIVLMDVRMPGTDGIAATRRIMAAASCEARVVMLTTFDMDEYVYEALKAGASGFLLKDVRPELLVTGIRAVHAGESLLAPTVTRRMIESFLDRPRAVDAGARERLASLTARERETLQLVARGMTNAEIATDLFVSETTVKTHVGRILMKLGLRDRVQAVIYAYETGLVSSGPG